MEQRRLAVYGGMFAGLFSAGCAYSGPIVINHSDGSAIDPEIEAFIRDGIIAELQGFNPDFAAGVPSITFYTSADLNWQCLTAAHNLSGCINPFNFEVYLNEILLNDPVFLANTLTHELAHILDFNTNIDDGYKDIGWTVGQAISSSDCDYPSTYAKTAPLEDFAEGIRVYTWDYHPADAVGHSEFDLDCSGGRDRYDYVKENIFAGYDWSTENPQAINFETLPLPINNTYNIPYTLFIAEPGTIGVAIPDQGTYSSWIYNEAHNGWDASAATSVSDENCSETDGLNVFCINGDGFVRYNLLENLRTAVPYNLNAAEYQTVEEHPFWDDGNYTWLYDDNSLVVYSSSGSNAYQAEDPAFSINFATRKVEQFENWDFFSSWQNHDESLDGFAIVKDASHQYWALNNWERMAWNKENERFDYDYSALSHRSRSPYNYYAEKTAIADSAIFKLYKDLAGTWLLSRQDLATNQVTHFTAPGFTDSDVLVSMAATDTHLYLIWYGNLQSKLVRIALDQLPAD